MKKANERFKIHLRDERGASEHTIRAYATDLTDFEEFLTEWAGHAVPPERVGSDAVRAYLGELYRRGLRATTVNRRLSSIRSLFRFLRREGCNVGDPAGEMPSLKTPKNLPTHLPVDDAARLMDLPDTDTWEGKRDKAMFEMLYGSGLRVSELTALNDGEADPAKRSDEIEGLRLKLAEERVLDLGSFDEVRRECPWKAFFLYLGEARGKPTESRPDGRILWADLQYAGPLPPADGHAKGDLDPLHVTLYDRHRFEVPVFPGPEPHTRLLRISLQAYNHVGQIERLADVLRSELSG